VNDKRDVIAFLEAAAERPDQINSGLLAEADRIARLIEGRVWAIVPEPFSHADESLAETVKSALENIPFRLLLFADTDQGRELAPLVAVQFGTMAVTDCHDIRFSGGSLQYIQHIYSGQFEQAISFRSYPEVATLHLHSLQTEESESDTPIPHGKIHLEGTRSKSGKRVIETIAPDFETVDIRYARRIVDIGFGCAEPELLEMALELARLLEASIATTRPMVDDGLCPKSRMIGQTGKTTAPDLCITLGVSGSPHHTAGLEKSRKIVSVNMDPSASILEVSDVGFVSDLHGVLPSLIRLIQQFRDRELG
jgi:electron transfer flavoprotein alpha subunit